MIYKHNHIEVYTDGSSRGNPGPGGYGIIIKTLTRPYIKEFYQGFNYTTNNRMELLSVIISLEYLKRCNKNITIFTDSKYVTNPLHKHWILKWKKKSFLNIKNTDLWKRFLRIYNQDGKINFFWLKGHAGNYYNNRCHDLAVNASKKKLIIDYGYCKIH